MKTKMNYALEQQAVLAQNIANADTPGYKARDVTPPDFKSLLGSGGKGSAHKLQMTTTSPMHMGMGVGANTEFKVHARATTDELKPNGNNVSIEEEMPKVAMNQADYQKVMGMYGKMVTMFKTAIGSPTTG